MKKIKAVLCVLTMAFLAAGCGNGNGNTPDQDETNEAFLGFVETAELIVDGLGGATSCQEFEDVVYATTDVFDCDGGGTASFSVSDVVCDAGPPLTVSFVFTASFDSCVDEFGDVVDGDLTLTYSGDEESDLTVALSSPGLTDGNLTLIINDVEVNVDFQTGLASSCSGSMQVDGNTCNVADDCSACTY